MKLTDAEWAVMTAVWEHYPATVREVADRIAAEHDWAYTTVKTILTRLADKGAVAVRKQGHRSLFEPLVARDEARRTAVRSLIDRAFDGAFGTLVQHLLNEEKLSAKETKQLREILRKSGKGDKQR